MNEEIRNLFPVTREMTYLDTAYISPTPTPVLQAGEAYAQRRSLGLSGRTEEWTALMEECKSKFARLVNAKPNQIAVTNNTSEGTNIVANMIDFKPGDNIVWDELDHISNKLIWLTIGKRKKVENLILSAVKGKVPLPAYQKVVNKRTRIISISLVSHHNGFHYDVEGLAELAHANGAYLHVDAIQAVGSIQVDLSRSGIDFLTCGAYKWLCGPQGLGFFYIREALLDRFNPLYGGWMQMENWLQDPINPKIDLYKDARKFQTATLDPRSMAELSVSLDLILQTGIENIEAHNLSLSSKLWAGLSKAGFDLYTPQGIRSSIVACHSTETGKIGEYLKQKNCIATAREDLLRFSPHFFNNEADIQRLLSLLEQFVNPD